VILNVIHAKVVIGWTALIIVLLVELSTVVLQVLLVTMLAILSARLAILDFG